MAKRHQVIAMLTIRRLLVVSTEDSTKLSSWSNVPYLFCRSLESKGIVLDRLTLKESMLLRQVIAVLKKFLGLFGGAASVWSYSRSSVYFRRAQKQIDQALKKSEVDAVLVLNFSYGPTLPAKVPLFMFCDWSFGYAIERQRGRELNKYEVLSSEREHDLLAAADEVFVLFPLAEDYIKRTRPEARTHYLGNVINAVADPYRDDITEKIEHASLLFVGKPHYIEGAKQLIAAYKNLKGTHPRLTVDIVGMNSSYFEDIPSGVTCHGYLDKGDAQQREVYYGLLRRARLFVNTTPEWASFSATLEALYFYTPIVTSKYPEIVRTLGDSLECGAYHEGSSSDLTAQIDFYLDNANFTESAIRAHEAVKNFGWDSYVEKFLRVMQATEKRNPRT